MEALREDSTGKNSYLIILWSKNKPYTIGGKDKDKYIIHAIDEISPLPP